MKLVRQLPSLILATSVTCTIAAPSGTGSTDITGAFVKVTATAPNRDTGRLVGVPLPFGDVGPQMREVASTPLGKLLDDYWAVKLDTNLHVTPHDDACDNPEKGLVQRVQSEVKAIGRSFAAYDISCNLARNGKVTILQNGTAQRLIYTLTDNWINFTATTPFTCRTGHGTPFCPSDPHFTLQFEAQLVIIIRSESLCTLTASSGEVISQNVTLEGNRNIAGGLANVLDGLVLGHKFRDAEQAIEATITKSNVPLDDKFKELRDNGACTGSNAITARAMKLFPELDVIATNTALIFQIDHLAIQSPSLLIPDPSRGVTAPAAPSFFHPEIAPSIPVVQSGASLTITGRYFQPNMNLATALPVTINHALVLGGVCAGGGTDLKWGPVDGPLRIDSLPGTLQGCAPSFTATRLSPGTSYRFSARDCDPVTCSPYSQVTQVTTAVASSSRGLLTLTLEGAPVGSSAVDPNGNFSAVIAVPANTATGRHTIAAVSGADRAQTDISVTSGATHATLMVVDITPGVNGCPNQPTTTLWTGADFLIFGAGFSPGPATLHMDSSTGIKMGVAAAQPNGTFCQPIRGVSQNQVGNHTLVMEQEGIGKAQLSVTVRQSHPLSVH